MHFSSSEKVVKDTTLLDENNALRDELRQLKKDNLDLNEHILFNKKMNKSRSRSQSRGRSRSRSKERKSKTHGGRSRGKNNPISLGIHEDLPHKLMVKKQNSSDELNSPDQHSIQAHRYEKPQENDSASNVDEEDLSSGGYANDSSEYSYEDGDSYFQETINKLLKENILLKRSHKAYERCHKELEDECEEHKATIKQLEDELQSEKTEREQVENDLKDLHKAHIALEQAHVELDYGMKKMLEDNVEMRKNLNFLEDSKKNDNNKQSTSGRSSFRKTFGKRDPPKRPDPPTRTDPPSRPISVYSSAGDKTPIPSTSSHEPPKPPPFSTRQKEYASDSGSSNKTNKKKHATEKPIKKVSPCSVRATAVSLFSKISFGSADFVDSIL